jgi:hypothetical protein
MKIDDNLANIFDIEPAEYKAIIVPQKTDIVVSDNHEEMVDSDYQNVRSNLYDLLDMGKDALMDLMDISRQSENPRSYEVMSNMMKQMAEINAQIMDTHQQKQKVSGITKKEASSGNLTQNNVIFNGSTTDLAKMLNDMNKG